MTWADEQSITRFDLNHAQFFRATADSHPPYVDESAYNFEKLIALAIAKKNRGFFSFRIAELCDHSVTFCDRDRPAIF